MREEKKKKTKEEEAKAKTRAYRLETILLAVQLIETRFFPNMFIRESLRQTIHYHLLVIKSTLQGHAVISPFLPRPDLNSLSLISLEKKATNIILF